MQWCTVGAATVLSVALALVCPGCAGVGLTLGGSPRGPSLLPSGRDDYPALAKELGLSGRVGLECRVDARGSAQDIVILESGGLVLDDAARKMFSAGHFLVPPDWSASGGSGKRFSYGVIFQLRGKAEVARFADSRLTVVVEGSATS